MGNTAWELRGAPHTDILVESRSQSEHEQRLESERRHAWIERHFHYFRMTSIFALTHVEPSAFCPPRLIIAAVKPSSPVDPQGGR